MKRKDIERKEKASNRAALLAEDRLRLPNAEQLKMESPYLSYKDRYDVPLQPSQIYLNGGHTHDLETHNPGLISEDMKVFAESHPSSLLTLQKLETYVSGIDPSRRASECLSILRIVIAEFRLLPLSVKEHFKEYTKSTAEQRSGYTRVLLWIDQLLLSIDQQVEFLKDQITQSGNPNILYQKDQIIQDFEKIKKSLAKEIKSFGINLTRQ